ncbi:MAG: hypothetical protein U5L03_13295 [Burkholderiaceae bacterium]|nr:hypothetical protein [Burkholderiaceae bacterium]
MRLVILIVLTLAAGLTALPQSEVWREASLSGPLEIYGGCAPCIFLPNGVAKHVRFG